MGHRATWLLALPESGSAQDRLAETVAGTVSGDGRTAEECFWLAAASLLVFGLPMVQRTRGNPGAGTQIKPGSLPKGVTPKRSKWPASSVRVIASEPTS